MDLIIGGAYQGKTAYAKEKYKLGEEDIFECTREGKIDLSKRCLTHFEEYLMYAYKNGISELPTFREDAIILMNDIFCGVVPIEKDIRGWREHAGRAGSELTRRAEHVTRIFCGLSQELK